VGPLLQDLAVDAIDVRVTRPADPCRVLGDRIKDRLNLGWRAGNHAEDFARRRLLPQGLFRLVEEADVLDRDRRLVGEGFQEMDLLRCKWLGFLAPQDEYADDVLAALQGDADEGSDVEETDAGVVFGIGLRVHDRGRSPIHQHAAGQAATVRLDRLIAPVPLHALLVDIADVRDQPPAVTFKLRDRAVIRGAQPYRVHGDALEDPLEIEHRLAHVLENFRYRRLTLERLLGRGEEPDVLDRDRGLLCECLQERYFSRRERPWYPATRDDDSDDLPTAKKWNAEHRSLNARKLARPRVVLLVRRDVRDMDRTSIGGDAPGQGWIVQPAKCFRARMP